MNIHAITTLLSGLCMALIGIASIVLWKRISGVEARWFGVGTALWSVAVLLKLVCGLLINESVIGYLKAALELPYFIVAAGVFIGLESCAFEIGLTWLATRLWPKLGRDAGRSIAIGIGAGALEAVLMSVPLLLGALAVFLDIEDAEGVREVMQTTAATTSLFWLVWPVERLMALLGHSSTRVLVLLGVAKGKPWMTLAGVLLFAWTDGLAGAFLVTPGHRSRSMWSIELAVLPGELVGIPVLLWCYRRWPPERTEMALAL